MEKLSPHTRCTESPRAEPDGWERVFDPPTSVRILPAKLARLLGTVSTLCLMIVAPISSSHAQAPSLGTAASFGVLAGSTVTNTVTPTVINGDVGVWSGTAVTGFPPGIVVGGTIHAGDAVAQQAQSDDTTAYNILAGMPVTQNLTGQDLGGKTLIAGVYGYTSTAQLTGTLTLDGQGNPNSVFIIKVASGLTTATASKIVLINGAQGGNVFFQVGSSAVLGVSTMFVGDILALTSITLDTGASINCGDALAQTGAVTLDNNVISICKLAAASASSALPSSASGNQRAVANAIDTFVTNGGTLPVAFQNLLSFLSPSQLANAMTQLSGEAGTAVAPTGIQAMNSFLSLLTNPFADTRTYTPPPPRPPLIYKALAFKAPAEAVPDPSRWGIWTATYGSDGNATGDLLAGSHDRSAHTYSSAVGADYRVTPDTKVGFALAGGRANWSVAQGLGGGHSDMFQPAIYSFTRINAAYVSAALTYSEFWASTNRTVTVAGTDQLNARFNAWGVGGRIEGGYQFTIPGWPGFGFTPYAAAQAVSFHTPSYSETAVSGSPQFALAYNAHTATALRSELGSWINKTTLLADGDTFTLFGRAAWAHDWDHDLASLTPTFLALPGASFVVNGARTPSDLALATAGAEWRLRSGWAMIAKFDGEFAPHAQIYTGTGILRYTF
jgi:uncharacterized protein with beta-barrel porin domain